MSEQWTTTQAASFGNMKRDSFTRLVRRDATAPQPVSRQPGAAGEYLFDAAAVRTWYATRPGQGARNDLRSTR